MKQAERLANCRMDNVRRIIGIDVEPCNK